jgi:hypothetical protein
MVEQKEYKRVMAIVRAHARDALGKHDTQRESFLAYCRNNWKRYAAGFSRSSAEGDRFAATLERATRDLIALAEAAPNKAEVMQILYGEQPPAWADSIEGAMDSVITYEAHQEPEIAPEPVDALPDAAADNTAPETAALSLAAAPPQADQHDAEQEDRATARYGFRSPTAEEPAAPEIAPPEHAQELQRKVRAVLMAHRPKTQD